MEIDLEGGKIKRVNIQDKFKDEVYENARYYGVKIDENNYLLKGEYDAEKGMLSQTRELCLV